MNDLPTSVKANLVTSKLLRYVIRETRIDSPERRALNSNIMAKYYSVNLHINPRTANYILNGLAKAYNEMPVYVTNYAEIKSEIKLAVEDILSQLEKQGIEVTKKRGQFKTYADLINYKA